jgi:hypothetical protein
VTQPMSEAVALASESSAFTFEAVAATEKELEKRETSDLLKKWCVFLAVPGAGQRGRAQPEFCGCRAARRGLGEDTTRFYRFRFRERFSPDTADTFLLDFFNSAAVRERFQVRRVVDTLAAVSLGVCICPLTSCAWL